ncbi:response regulator receiver domain protein [Leptospira weilii serovar Topaz str. LT2116]|uniref:Response regulator receiver domain protein n=1 Tax=Leptospira weilii serovar Topaz str. LT2116 TaxID=1088540 RepID=M3GWU9_9LEPT|nr:response regulator receiver domain protein [Leptospira weilii serovar Topaz str. LT2116]
MKTILVIEDDPDIGNLIRKSLDSAHYSTTLQTSGEEGLKFYKANHPDMVILDLSLPDIDGIEVCRTVRRNDENTPIFIVTARNEEIDRIMGLELGADDYITKPFSVRELKTRVDVFFRRWDKKAGIKPNVGASGEIIRGALKIDPVRRRVTLKDNIVNISRKEFDILQLMAASPGKVFSREMILEAVWGMEWDGFERMIDSHVKRIRSKLEKIRLNPNGLKQSGESVIDLRTITTTS